MAASHGLLLEAIANGGEGCSPGNEDLLGGGTKPIRIWRSLDHPISRASETNLKAPIRLLVTGIPFTSGDPQSSPWLFQY